MAFLGTLKYRIIALAPRLWFYKKISTPPPRKITGFEISVAHWYERLWKFLHMLHLLHGFEHTTRTWMPTLKLTLYVDFIRFGFLCFKGKIKDLEKKCVFSFEMNEWMNEWEFLVFASSILSHENKNVHFIIKYFDRKWL